MAYILKTRREFRYSQIQKKNGHGKAMAEIAVTLPEAKDCQGLVATTRR